MGWSNGFTDRHESEDGVSMKAKPIPDYMSFFSAEAIELVKWSSLERNRAKARNIYEVGCRFEYHYRKRLTGDTSPDVHVWSGRGGSRHAQSLLIIQCAERCRARKGG